MGPQIRLTLVDRNPGMIEAWKVAFAEHDLLDKIVIEFGDIFDFTPHDAVVSPANSFGYMDGGIDLAYRNYFGLGIETDVITTIRTVWGGALPVGRAMVIHTFDHGRKSVPYLVVAPTMQVAGMDVSKSNNAYLALRGALGAVHAFNEHLLPARNLPPPTPSARTAGRIITLACPGLATGVGRMEYNIAAKQMARAYHEYLHPPVSAKGIAVNS